jgi:hypothetical protein
MNLNLQSLKALSADPQFARLAAATIVAETVLESTREHVNGYIKVVFEEFTKHHPFYDDLTQRCPVPPAQRDLITDPKMLYLSEDDETLKEYYDLCDKAHRMAGYDLPTGHCPALVAENILRDAEHELLEYAEKQLDVPFTASQLELRDQALHILHGIALQNPETERIARSSLPRSRPETAAWLKTDKIQLAA